MRTISMSHCLWEQLADYSATITHLFTLPLWQHDGTRHMLSHPSVSTLHSNRIDVHRRDKYCYGMQKVWGLSEILYRIFSKFYNFHQLLTVDLVSVVFKGRVVLEQCFHKKPKYVGLKIYNLCSSIWYIRHWSIFGEGMTAHSLTVDSSTCHSDSTD